MNAETTLPLDSPSPVSTNQKMRNAKKLSLVVGPELQSRCVCGRGTQTAGIIESPQSFHSRPSSPSSAKHIFRHHSDKTAENSFSLFHPMCAFCSPLTAQPRDQSSFDQPDAIYYPNGPTCILEPNLWLYSEPVNIPLTEFNVVINVAKEVNIDFDVNDDTEYLKFDWEHGSQTLVEDLPNIVETMEQRLAEHKKILVHCQCGISRSATLLIAFIMYYKNIDISLAYDFVKKKSPNISPNMNLMFQLNEWGEWLKESGRNKSSSAIRTPISPPIHQIQSISHS